MLKYDSIYFLHIMKTGGRHLRNSVFIPMTDQLQRNNIKIINNNNYPHTGWHSKITDKTYIVTILRDPVEQAVSLFAHNISLDKDGKQKKIYNLSNLEKNKFLQYVVDYPERQNFQSKSYMHDEFNNTELGNKELFLENNIFMKRKNRVNLTLRTKDIKNNEKNIQEKIFLDLGIGDITKSKPAFFSNKNFYNHESKNLYNSLLDNEKKFILEHNKIDKDLYENSKYFKVEK